MFKWIFSCFGVRNVLSNRNWLIPLYVVKPDFSREFPPYFEFYRYLSNPVVLKMGGIAPRWALKPFQGDNSEVRSI